MSVKTIDESKSIISRRNFGEKYITQKVNVMLAVERTNQVIF